MKKKSFLILGIGLVLFMVGYVLAEQNFGVYNLKTPKNIRTLVLPNAADRSPVISLGVATDPKSGELVEGYAFIHYKEINPKAKKPNKGGPVCYGFLAKGAKWNTIEPWVLNAQNQRGLSETFVYENISGNINKWEDAADGFLGNGSYIDILGEGSTTSYPLSADTAAPDGQNEIYFADISDPNAIAVTIVWGVFSGRIENRKIVEWDQVYDDVDYDWSLSGEPEKMDFENISTHELGHSVGMDDVYESLCSEVTMYGYATVGETKKRTLEPADVLGVSTLY